MILDNIQTPNACQYVKIGAAVQNIGPNQFQRSCTTQASKKLKTTMITKIIIQLPAPVSLIINKFKKKGASSGIRTLT